MKAIIVSTDNEIKKIEVEQNGEPLYGLIKGAVGGWFENVHPRRLPDKYIMIVNEEGLIIGLSENAIGSYLYETDKHGSPIVGNIIFLKNGMFCGEPDVVGLSDEEADELMTLLERLKGEINND
jgi:hypothetical protein